MCKIAICAGEYVFATFIKIFGSWGSKIVKIGPKSMKTGENDKNLTFLDLCGHWNPRNFSKLVHKIVVCSNEWFLVLLAIFFKIFGPWGSKSQNWNKKSENSWRWWTSWHFWICGDTGTPEIFLNLFIQLTGFWHFWPYFSIYLVRGNQKMIEIGWKVQK